jgi:hypothetical protein
VEALRDLYLRALDRAIENNRLSGGLGLFVLPFLIKNALDADRSDPSMVASRWALTALAALACGYRLTIKRRRLQRERRVAQDG